MKPYIVRQPSVSLGLHDAIEHNYFDFFCNNTALDLSGYFDTDIWNRLVLQICSEEPFARQAVVAIGALTKSTDVVADIVNPETLEAARSHYEYALQQYGKAVRLMQDISRQDKDTRFRNTLVSALLTTCFESCIGNQENAMAQAQAGVELLAAYQVEPRLRDKYTFPDKDLVSTFARLDSQILMFKDTRAPSSKSRSWNPVTHSLSPSLQELPSVFDSVKEARIHWDHIVEVAMLWRAASHPSGFSTLDFGENNVRESLWKADTIAQKIRHELQLYTASTEQWFQSFQPVFERAQAQKDSKDFLGASILMIKYLSSRVALLGSLQESNPYEDKLLPDYISIVKLAGNLLKGGSRNLSRGKPIFIFDDSLVAGLFLVATRCRERTVRRQAIDLLQRYPRREGLWDSLMAVKVATWFMEAEEEGLEGDYIPPSARMKIVKNEFVLSERKAVVRCSKIADVDGVDVLPEVTLMW